jgi:hypothetical protein
VKEKWCLQENTTLGVCRAYRAAVMRNHAGTTQAYGCPLQLAQARRLPRTLISEKTKSGELRLVGLPVVVADCGEAMEGCLELKAYHETHMSSTWLGLLVCQHPLLLSDTQFGVH